MNRETQLEEALERCVRILARAELELADSLRDEDIAALIRECRRLLGIADFY